MPESPLLAGSAGTHETVLRPTGDVVIQDLPTRRACQADGAARLCSTPPKTAGVGKLTETLKWGQPSYLTEETGSGTTVRIDRLKAGDGYAIYFHCQSGLVGQFRELYPDTFTYRRRTGDAFRRQGSPAGPRIAPLHCARLDPSSTKEGQTRRMRWRDA